MTNHFKGILSLMKDLEARQDKRRLATEKEDQELDAIKEKVRLAMIHGETFIKQEWTAPDGLTERTVPPAEAYGQPQLYANPDGVVYVRNPVDLRWRTVSQSKIPEPTPDYIRELQRLKAQHMKEIYGTTVPDVQPPTFCVHEFVNVSFTGIKMVCKHCDVEQIL